MATTEPIFVIEENIQRYRALLAQNDISTVMRETVTRLLAEARASLSSADRSETIVVPQR